MNLYLQLSFKVGARPFPTEIHYYDSSLWYAKYAHLINLAHLNDAGEKETCASTTKLFFIVL